MFDKNVPQRLHINHRQDLRGVHSKFFMTEEDRPTADDFQIRETFMTTNNKNVMRGMHFQVKTPQTKILTCVSGSAQVKTIALDSLNSSEPEIHTFFMTGYVEDLSQLYVPGDYALGYFVYDDLTRMLYMTDGDFDPENDSGVHPFSHQIDWPVNESEVILSNRDRSLPTIDEFVDFR